MENSASERMHKVLKSVLGILVLGIVYAVFVDVSGLSVPCIFHSLTGYLCPGCGITRLMLSLLHGDAEGARNANAFVYYLLPFAIVYILYRVFRYVRYDKSDFNKAEVVMLTAVLILTLAWGFYRNIYMA